MTLRNPPIHYGWHIVWAGTLCIFASLGLGRFALGMLLPAMGHGLSLSYSQMGLIGTCNFIGYLLAVLFSGALIERVGTRRLIFAGLLAIGISMLMIGNAHSFTVIILLYTVTGIGSGTSNVPMMALVSAWFASRLRGKAAGFIVIGSGFAILLAGRLIPYLNRIGGAEGWRLGWTVLGMIVLAVSLVCLLVLRNRPADCGLNPIGQQAVVSPSSMVNDVVPSRMDRGLIARMGAIYFLFGYTYVIYATFIVTTLIQDRGFSENTAGSFWSWVGLLSLFSGPVFGTLSDRIGRKQCLAIVFSIQTLAYLFVALPLPAVFLYLSIGCFGIVAWSIPSIMAALVGDYVGPQHAARIFGFITFIFAIGQIAGPAVAGYLAEQTGSFSSSYFMAAILAILAVIYSTRLKKPDPTHL
jgi:sugar phosphate permease